MELIKNMITTCETMAKGTAQAMADGDIIVPDTKPDILKLLQVDSDACITDKYIENGKLILCGRVNYKVLYIPDGDDEKIKSILTSMDFRQVVDIKTTDDTEYIISKPTVARVEFNAVNSRKLRLRAIIHIDYEVCKLNDIEITTDIEDECIEKKTSNMCFENAVNISEHEFTVKEKLTVVTGKNSINEILKTDVKIYDTEYKPVTGKVVVKGIAEICILYTDSEGDIKFVESETPFTEVLDTEGVGENSMCDIDYCVINTMCSPEPDMDGDLRDIVIDIDICASLKATESVEKEILSDCFVPYCKMKEEKSNLILKTTTERPVSQNTLRDTIEVPQNVPSVRGVYNIMTNAIITKSELERNKIICEGRVEAYVLYLTDTPETPVYSLKKDIPFSYMIECKNDADTSECAIKTSVKHANYSLNGSGEIEIRCVLSIECMLTKEISIENITEIETQERESRQGIVIYFASSGEHIWDISKHYGVPCSTLCEYNGIDNDKIDKSRKLFIPMR